MEIAKVWNLDGFSIHPEANISLLQQSIELAVSALPAARLHSDEPMTDRVRLHGLALDDALKTASTLLAASSAQCTLAAPPADIKMVPDGSGNLIFRCNHASAHRWQLDGKKI